MNKPTAEDLYDLESNNNPLVLLAKAVNGDRPPITEKDCKKCCWACDHTKFKEGFTGAVKFCDLLPKAEVSINTPITNMDCNGKDFQLKKELV